ncbi:hypothetical protein K505DRAFT_366008 [Melanomma pulvis-pyrius CBS 109.77]|uniref:Uncharacterized protein n=1 Tax=Melanomma pulvis-pyrius CBS 109.77 TaxID=1314802 RepID=A0A6A6WYI2_9PLEO|nr:hypothetical protein K505DRAFT_366008 [Melanomma pulvis-pyrius CBS 109.77]
MPRFLPSLSKIRQTTQTYTKIRVPSERVPPHRASGRKQTFIPTLLFAMECRLFVFLSMADASSPQPPTIPSMDPYYFIGRLDEAAAETLAKLAADGELELQLSLSVDNEPSTTPHSEIAGFLEVILYGPKSRTDNVGAFTGQCGHYLQDPANCARNVPYLNPQRLASVDGHLPMTFDLQQHQVYSVDNFTRVASDLLSNFETTNEIAPANTPCALRTQQKYIRDRRSHSSRTENLAWARRGQTLPSGYEDTALPARFYINTITDQE